MAYVAPSNRSTGDVISAEIWDQDLVTNVIAINAGAVSVASQATDDLIYCSSATQLARIANAARALVAKGGRIFLRNLDTGLWSEISPPS